MKCAREFVFQLLQLERKSCNNSLPKPLFRLASQFMSDIISQWRLAVCVCPCPCKYWQSLNNQIFYQILQELHRILIIHSVNRVKTYHLTNLLFLTCSVLLTTNCSEISNKNRFQFKIYGRNYSETCVSDHLHITTAFGRFFWPTFYFNKYRV